MGRPQFSQSGTEGGGQTVAITTRPEVKSVVATQTGSVGSGATEKTEVYAPTGSVYSINGIFLRVNADGTAASGDHSAFIRPLGDFATMHGSQPHTDNILFGRGYWKNMNTAEPPTEAAQAATLQALQATENSPLVFEYRNNTDAAQDNDRVYQLVVNEDSY